MAREMPIEGGDNTPIGGLLVPEQFERVADSLLARRSVFQ
jgi:hypothetical protein